MREPTKFKNPINTMEVLSNLEKILLKCFIFPKKHSTKCEKGKYEIVRLLLENGAIYNAKNNLDKTPLQLTQDENTKGLFDKVEKLFWLLGDKKSDKKHIYQVYQEVVNSRNEKGYTFLHKTIVNCLYKFINPLLQAGADPNLVANNGNSPLHAAINNAGAVKSLLEKGANFNARDKDGRTPLHWAIFNLKHNIFIIKHLLEKGADPTLTTNNGCTSLHIASHVKMVIARK